ncbi:MAG: transcriptional regulator GlxA family with amidase domain [Candidatus Endobugula sp.]|jgi:transcriptional regulator GlxA family with amidase domain
MKKTTIKAVFVLSPQMLSTSMSWPADMFSAANQAAKTLCPDSPPIELITTAVKQVTHKAQDLPFALSPSHVLSDIRQADLIYLPALWRNPRPILADSQALIPWLQKHYEQGALISGVGTGCCFMAEAGLLNHKPATTHWYYFDQFQKQYPLVKLKRQHFITQAGNLYCAASINSLADLTIHFIQQFFNKAVAQHIERHFSHEVRRAYETVSYFEDGNINHSDEEILQIQLWIKTNVSKLISIDNMAIQCNMSKRNFSRRFKEATAKTPLQYLQDIRMDTACDLLQSSNLFIGDIADKVGYSDVSHFSQVFRKKLALSPSDYRTTVRAKLFHEERSAFDRN